MINKDYRKAVLVSLKSECLIWGRRNRFSLTFKSTHTWTAAANQHPAVGKSGVVETDEKKKKSHVLILAEPLKGVFVSLKPNSGLTIFSNK